MTILPTGHSEYIEDTISIQHTGLFCLDAISDGRPVSGLLIGELVEFQI
jgi:hypothetical protein